MNGQEEPRKESSLEAAVHPMDCGRDKMTCTRRRVLPGSGLLCSVPRHAPEAEILGRVAEGIAHHFNNLFTIILGNVGLATGVRGVPDQVVHHLDKIHTATQRAACVVRQLVCFSRHGDGPRSRTNASTFLTVIAQLLQTMLDNDVQVRCHIPRELPCLMLDKTEMRQAILNVCLNARDAITGRGSITIEAQMVDLPPQFCDLHPGVEPGPHLLVCIDDSGTGMDKETLGRMFEPFFTTKEPSRNLGLGLPAAYGIVAGHRGCIDVESEVGKGTRFRIFLPAAEETQAQDDGKGTGNA